MTWLLTRILDWLLDFVLGKIAETAWPWLSLGIASLLSMLGPVEESPIFLLDRRTQLTNLTSHDRRVSDNFGGPTLLSA